MRAAALAIGLFVSGCAFTPETIRIIPTFAAAPERGAERVELKLEVADLRPEPTDVVARKVNGFGMQLAPISSDVPVVDVLKQAAVSAITARGYRVGTAGALVLTLELLVFSHAFIPGFWSAKSEATLIFLATLRDASGKELLRKVMSDAFHHQVQLAVGDNVVKAYEGVLVQSLERLVTLEAFRTALTGSAAPPPL
ncbi:MAG: hypothetical protein JNM17_33295 [Archangium sp.]|nr:hypothetical protein [Archangium sp.]